MWGYLWWRILCLLRTDLIEFQRLSVTIAYYRPGLPYLSTLVTSKVWVEPPMLKQKLWSLIAPLHIEIFQRNLVWSLQMPWSTRTPKRIEIRRLRSEILAPAEMAKLVFVLLLLFLLFLGHVYTTLCTGQTIGPTDLVIGPFQGSSCADVPFSYWSWKSVHSFPRCGSLKVPFNC